MKEVAMFRGLTTEADGLMMIKVMVEKLKAAMPVNAVFRLHKGRLFCELSDNDFENHLGEVIKKLQYCIDRECDMNIDNQYIWLLSAKSGKSLMVKLWSPRSLHHYRTNV